MSSFLCISVRFLQQLFHGRTDGDEPEWPPSPLRLFQALVAAAAAQRNQRMRLEDGAPAFRWLESMPCPVIVAAPGRKAQKGYRIYFPDNVGDILAAAWRRGANADIAEYREKKDIRPTHLEGNGVHYLFPIAANGADVAEH